MSDEHPEGSISVERRGHVLLMGLNRPSKYNGYTPKMSDELVDAFTMLDSDPELRCGVVFGHGPHFTAGLDLPMWTERMKESPKSNTDKIDPMALGRTCRKPVVAAMHGISFTLGLELALACDIIIAADDCRCSQLEPKRGIHATGGATIRFVQRGGWGNAMYHLLTADEFDAHEAYRIGIAQEVVPAGTQLDRAIEIAESIAAIAPLAIQATKASSKRFIDEGFRATVNAFGPDQAALIASNDAKEGVQSFIERREAKFTGT